MGEKSTLLKEFAWKSKAGYVGYSSLSKITIPIFNKVLAFILILLAIPLFIIIGAIIKLKDKGPVFYKGERLGLNKKLFTMYKFRTLPVDAQKRIGAKILSPKDFRLPWFSRFLRDTRLDELPQLFNILKGDMDFVGPRPLRPEIYEKYCKNIPNFDLRFKVRPGLIGYSQLCTPHSAPKRIRALIDNISIRLKRSLLWDLLVIAVTILVLIYKTVAMLSSGFWKYIVSERVLKRFKEKRLYDRIKQESSFLEVLDKNGNHVLRLPVEDINEEYFRVKSDYIDDKLKSLKEGKLVCIAKDHKKKISSVNIELTKHYFLEKGNKKEHYLVFKYLPKTDFSRYIIDKYFLKKAIINIL